MRFLDVQPIYGGSILVTVKGVVRTTGIRFPVSSNFGFLIKALSNMETKGRSNSQSPLHWCQLFAPRAPPSMPFPTTRTDSFDLRNA